MRGPAKDTVVFVVVAGREDHGAGPVTEQDANVAIVPIDPPAERIGPHHDGVFDGVAGIVQKLAGRHGTEEKTGACRRQIIREGILAAQGAGDGGSVAEHVIGRGGGNDDEIDVLGVQAGHFQCIGRGLDREGLERFGLLLVIVRVGMRQEMTLRYSSPGRDPLVAGVDDGLQILIGHNVLGRGRSNTNGTAAQGSGCRHGEGRRRRRGRSRRRVSIVA
mmetsp:Transcript_671/g.1887  ORF Transcript_671/g.1887 Transcript_671/m.1887 type:complete len:219 (-) Transcript_671:195-851(-)